MNKLFTELRRRNIFRVAGVYAVVGWILMQVAGALETSLKLPDWFDSAITATLLIGFPIAMLLAWAFEMTPEGVKRTETVAEGESVTAKTGRALDYVIVAGLVLVAALVIWQGTRTPALSPFEAAKNAAPQGEVIDNVNANPHPEVLGGSQAMRDANTNTDPASIAVLPFTDLSPNKDQEYFSQGIAEEILNVLVNVKGLEVASRTSSFQFAGQEKIGIPLIAQQLHVRNILEGSVRKAGDTIRITAQLIDAETDKHLWSDTFDRTLTTDNIFAVQDEIAKAIVEQLSSRMGTKTITAPATRKADTENTDAYALFLEGQTLFVLRGEANILRSIEVLERAVEIDPGFARAWAALAADYSVATGWFSGANLNRDFYVLAKEAARKAIALDPALSLPYAVLADKAQNIGNFEESLALFAQAIARNPKDETIYMWRAQLWLDLGFFDRAIADYNICLSLNPDYNLCRDSKSETQIIAGDVTAGLATLIDVKRRGFEPGGSNPAQMGAALSQHNEIMVLYQLIFSAEGLGPGNMRWAVDMFYSALTNPTYDKKEALRVMEVRLEGMGSPLAPGSWNTTLVRFLFGAYDRMHPYGGGWWWVTADYPEWAASPERKRLIKERKLDVYWRKNGFPPQCKPVGENDFACD